MPVDPRRKNAKFNFGLNGLVTKESPTLLTDGQYRNMSNMDVVQEGSISSRSGTKYLGNLGVGVAECYMIRKMVINPAEDPQVPSINPRYAGMFDAGAYKIIRSLNYSAGVTVATGINSTIANAYRKAFDMAVYAAGEVGGPWAFIASELKMLKDSGNAPYGALPRWGILPAFGVATATPGGPGSGVLDGGDTLSPNSSTAYDYRYTYQDPNTRNEGNPSQTMLDTSDVPNGVPAAVHLQDVTVTGYGTGDLPAGVPVNIYRRGGLLFDAWRFVGQVPNPGANATWTFTDNSADVDIIFARLMETDNDPPVPSTVQDPNKAKATIPGVSAGYQTVAISAGDISSITPGTQMFCIFDAQETITVVSVAGGSFTAYFQRDQPVGTTIFADTICGQPCNLAVAYQQFVVVAGDPNNPHILYRSKGDMPEAFPVVTADGSVATAACGTPSNPVLKIYEFRGQICTLNLYSIFETLILQGSLVTPAKVADRGTVGTRANCKTDSEIWFLSWDGVWSWDGATCRKRSESIDPIFHGQQVNGISPISFRIAGGIDYASLCVMESRRGQVYLIYYGEDGQPHEILCEPSFGDRWRPYDPTDSTNSTFLYTEPDTQEMIEAKFGPFAGAPFHMIDQYRNSGGVSYTAFDFDQGGVWNPPAAGSGGSPIPFNLRLPWFDVGEPAKAKLFEEAILELDSTGSGAGSALTVAVLIDFNDTPVDTLVVTLPVAGGRSLVSLLPQIVAFLGNAGSEGREARAVSFYISGTAWPTQIQLFSLTIYYQDLDYLTGGGSTDWTDLGYQHDKRLYQMTVTFDMEGVDRQIAIDTLTGVDGNTTNLRTQTFVLSNPVITGGGGRAKKTFPLADNTIVKMIRVRPYAFGATAGHASIDLFKIFSVEFPEQENYPPDIVSFTPWEDGGYPFPKFLNQATLDVDTNGVAVTVKIWADNAIVATEVVTGSQGNRDQNLTTPPNISGKKWRISVDVAQDAIATGGGKFQLWNPGSIFRFQPADRGEVGHTFDWDDLGHPWDKYLKSVTVEWDNTGGADVTLQMDTLTGINGQTVNAAVATFLITGGRSKREFPLPKDTIAKMIRIYPTAAPPVTFKQWKYLVDKVDYPSDIVLSTEWKNAETPDNKNPSWISIDADTAGVICNVTLENESGNVMVVGHVGTVTNRMKNYAIPVDVFAKMWRLTIVLGVGGKFQLFAWAFSRWQPTQKSSPVDPPEIVTWTPWKEAESPNDKNPTVLSIDAFTNGVACQVNLFNEIGLVMSILHMGTVTNRMGNYPIPVDVRAKMWRLTDSPINAGQFQLWDWGFHRWQPTAEGSPSDPPEVIFWTPWNDWGWPYGTIGRNLILTIDTGGVACSIFLQTENGTVQVFQVRQTYTNRRVVFAINANLIGLQWRLLLVPSTAFGLARLWDWAMDVVKEPAAVNQWSSYQQGFGYKGFKIIRQVWLEYQSDQPFGFIITSDTGSITLHVPAHPARAVERYLLPSAFGSGLNKSKLYTFSWGVSVSTVKMYSDMSGVEWLPQGMEQHAGYQQTLLSEFMTLGI